MAVVAGFAIGALLLSVGFALATFVSVRHYMVTQRQHSALHSAYNDADRIKAALAHNVGPHAALARLRIGRKNTTTHLRVDGHWHSSGRLAGDRSVTRGVQSAVRDGSVAFAWTDATTPPSLVVGIPLPAVDAEYYEVVPARVLQRTLAAIERTLILCAAIATLAGTILGWLASRRIMAPLNVVADAAGRIAGGDLATRLPDTRDPDLAGLVTSFNTMVDAVVDRIEQDARFAANVSHELRTPLATLTTSLGVLQHDHDLSGRARAAVDLMSTELVRFRQALEDLIALERLDNEGGAEVEIAPIADIVERVAVENGVDDAVVDLSMVEPGLEVEVNRLEIRNALSNLIRNANTHGGGVRALRLVRRGDAVEIHVTDHGPGVPAEDRSRVFERFTRLGARGSSGGSGLGLSIVARTASVHSGTVECRTNAPRGADFVFSLPVVGHR